MSTETAEVIQDDLEKPELQSDADQNSVDTTGAEEPVARRNKRAERRINKLTARLAAEREEKDLLKKRLDGLEETVKNITPKQARPQRDDYGADEDYEDALIDFRIQDKIPKPVSASPAPSPKPEGEMRNRSTTYISEMEGTREGFAQVVANATFPLTEHAWGEIMDMGGDGADVFIALNANPSEATRISQLPVHEQTIQLEKLADSLDKSSAPEPISPVTGNDAQPVDESKLTDAQWIERRNKQVHGRYN